MPPAVFIKRIVKTRSGQNMPEKRVHSEFIGVDLFAGAGGMSLGASMAGVDVRLAVEIDANAAATYKHNHPGTRLIIDDISNVKSIDVPKRGKNSVLFGGPPCQGFSTSNQRTRNTENPTNWLFKEFARIASIWKPDWVVFENVRGIVETENGIFRDSIIHELEALGYKCSDGILCAADFGVPQIRSRFFLTASRDGISVKMPKPTTPRTACVRQAIADLPALSNGASVDILPYRNNPRSKYSKSMRNGNDTCTGHLVTCNAPHIIERYKHIPQGGNWENIPVDLLSNYTDRTRCHTGIYRRLKEDRPSVRRIRHCALGVAG